MCRYSTSGHGLADMVVLGGWLDLMILEVFSNLNDSMFLSVQPGASTDHRGWDTDPRLLCICLD